jgi:hypothetical protein
MAAIEVPVSKRTVYECIAAVAGEMAQEGIGKTRKNEQQGYRFRGIDEVFNALSPVLAKYRLVILPRVISRTVVERATKSGGVLFYVIVESEFDFVSADDGSSHTVKTFGEAMDSADKATNKAMSSAYKYAAFQTFCIPIEGTPDADATTHEPAPSTAAVAAALEPPAGYAEFRKTFVAAVEQGMPALLAVWKGTTEACRNYMDKTERAARDGMKAAAQAASDHAAAKERAAVAALGVPPVTQTELPPAKVAKDTKATKPLPPIGVPA